MARVTVEDCIVQVPNRFELVMFAAQRARDISAGAQITLDRDRDKNPVVALREIAETKLDQGMLKDSLISGMQKHADIDKPEEVNEMAELEQELAAALAQGGAEAAQPKALPMAEEDDVAEYRAARWLQPTLAAAGSANPAAQTSWRRRDRPHIMDDRHDSSV